MEETKLKQLLGQALERGLSGMEDDPWLAGRVLDLAHEKGKNKMKKKLSAGLLLALLLVVCSAAALAWALSRQYFEDVARLQAAGGYYDEWGLEEKLEMADILLKHGLITESEAAALNTEEAIDAFMRERYGVDGRTDVVGLEAILEKELGPMEAWSPEEKAWYSEMLLDAGLQAADSDEPVYVAPEAGDVQPDEAVAIAKKAVVQAFGMDENALDAYRVEVVFQSFSDEEYKEPHYDVSFWGDGYGDFYSCSLTRDGRIMDSSMGDLYLSPAEQTEEKRQFLLDNDLEASALFSQYAREHIDGDSVFAFWPLEDKKAVTDMLRPVILENMAETPGYNDQTCMFWASHFYGLPDDRAISREEALTVAKEALREPFGLTAEQTALLDRTGLFYETTDPDAPLWKVVLRVGETRDAVARIGLSTETGYRVVLDAYSGRVLETRSFTSLPANDPEAVALSN